MTRTLFSTVFAAVLAASSILPGIAQAQDAPVWEAGSVYDFSQAQARSLLDDADENTSFTIDEAQTVSRWAFNEIELLSQGIQVDYSRGGAYLGDYQLYDRFDVQGAEVDFVKSAPFLINAKKHKAATLSNNQRRQNKAIDSAGRSLNNFANARSAWGLIDGHESGFYGLTTRDARSKQGFAAQVYYGNYGF